LELDTDNLKGNQVGENSQKTKQFEKYDLDHIPEPEERTPHEDTYESYTLEDRK
jgi:hypothetical protein